MKTTLKLLAILLLFAAPVLADDIIVDYKFDGGRGNIGKIDVFALGPIVIVLSGFDGPFSFADMWEKNAGPGDTGIGLADNVHHEINSSEFVQVNLTGILLFHPQSVGLTVGSLVREEGESYDVWGSNTPGQRGVSLGVNETMTDFTLPGDTFPFISLSGHEGNVLLEDVTADFRSTVPTPEPSTRPGATRG